MESKNSDHAQAICDGDGDGELGHPRIYLHVSTDKETVCPYCSRRYILAENAKQEAEH